MLQNKFHAVQVKDGWIKLGYSEKGLKECGFPSKSDKRFVAIKNPKYIVKLSKDITKYFSGQKVDFKCSFDLEDFSVFEKAVWKATKLIPYGKKISYGELSKRLGKPKAARAVGNALGKNPVPIVIPCHRVIKSDGSLGGFSGGLGWKKRLLDMEQSQ